MKSYNRKGAVKATVITGFTPKGAIKVRDGDDIGLGHAWLANNTPMVGDYLIFDNGTWSCCTARQFALDYDCDDEPEQEPPVAGAETVSLEQAIADIDHDDDSHWTQGGLPSMSYIEGATGDKDLKRADVEEIAPDLERVV